MIREALRVVARAACDNPRRALGWRQGQQLCQRPARLERIGMLQVFQLQMQVDPQLQRQPRRGDQRRADGRVADGIMRRTDIVECQGHARLAC